MKAYKLYSKYIQVGSEFEINIGWEERERFFSLMHNYDEWVSDEIEMNAMDLVVLFDNSIDEMMKLMDYSKQRFTYQSL